MTDTRRYELDWLRVLAFGLLILYHIGMYYVADWGWHIKSEHQSQPLQYLMLWTNQWRMSLLFLISGSAVAFILPKISAWQFFRSRHTRILVPLLFGMLVVVVPQVYFEAQSIGLIDADYGFFRFWGDYLNQHSALFAEHKTIGDWHLTWNHLWYLAYILVYSQIIWGLHHFARWLGLQITFKALVSHMPSFILALIIPVCWLMMNGNLFYERFPQTHAFYDDFYNHGRYFFVFAFGFFMVKSPSLWQWIAQVRVFTLTAALFSYAGVVFLFSGHSLGDGQIPNFIWSANSWLWMLAVCGWAQHLLNFNHPALRYLNSGVYCFYILHQTLIITFASWLGDFQLGPVVEPLLLTILTVLGCWLGFEGIKRLPYLRLVFGISHKAPRRQPSPDYRARAQSVR